MLATIPCSGVYSSTNWPPFSIGQNSILNWVLKLSHLKIKNYLDSLEKALFFFTFRSHQWCWKFVQKEKLQSGELNVCAWQTSFSAIFVLNKIKQSILQITHIRNKTLDTWASSQPMSWTIAKGPNSSPGSFYFLTTSKKLGHQMMHGNRLLENLWSPKLPKLPGAYSASLNSQLHQCANLSWVIAYDHKT